MPHLLKTRRNINFIEEDVDDFNILINNLKKPESILINCGICGSKTQEQTVHYKLEKTQFIILRINRSKYFNAKFISCNKKIKGFDSQGIVISGKYKFKANSAVCHIGELEIGHYYCMVMKSKQWYIIDDTKSQQSSHLDLDLLNVYYLLLERETS